MGLTNETYVPLSRGLLKHLKGMTGNEIKIYLYLLMRATVTGERKGMLACPIRSIAEEVGMNYTLVWRALKRLTPRYIDYEPAKNQFDVTAFKVKKYKNIKDYAVSYSKQQRQERVNSNVNNNVNSGSTAGKQHTPSEVQKDTPNKSLEVLRRKEVEEKVKPPLLLYEKNIGFLSPLIRDMIFDLVEQTSEKIVCGAIKEAAKHNGRNIAYVESIAKRWHAEGYETAHDKPYCYLVDGTPIKTKEELQKLDKEGKIDWNERKEKWEKIV